MEKKWGIGIAILRLVSMRLHCSIDRILFTIVIEQLYASVSWSTCMYQISNRGGFIS